MNNKDHIYKKMSSNNRFVAIYPTEYVVTASRLPAAVKLIYQNSINNNLNLMQQDLYMNLNANLMSGPPLPTTKYEDLPQNAKIMDVLPVYTKGMSDQSYFTFKDLHKQKYYRFVGYKDNTGKINFIPVKLENDKRKKKML